MSQTTSVISRVIRSAIEKPSETDLIGTVLDPAGGEIQLPITLVNWRGRNHLKLDAKPFDPDEMMGLLDPAQMDESLTNKVTIRPLPSYHKFGVTYLNRIQVATNRLIEAVDNYNRGQHVDLRQARMFLQGALIFFEDTIIETLGGKRGLLAHHVAGMRIKYSMMTPAAGTHTIKHDEVLIPEDVAKKMLVKPGDMIMAHREPLLWGRGIQFLIAVVSKETDSVRLPWSVFQGMGADCDGDLIFLCNITRHLEHASEEDRFTALTEIFEARTKDAGEKEFSSSLLLLHDNPRDLETDKRVDDLTGLSFGVEDIIGESGEDVFLEVLDAHHGIKPERILSIARDLTQAEWGDEILKTAKALYYTKTSLGIVGAMGTACLALGTAWPAAMPAAVAIKQGLSQAVLDAKHGKDLDHINTCLAALIKSGDFKESGVEARINAMVSHGFDVDKITALFKVLGDDGLVARVYRDFPGLMLTTSDSHTASMLARFTAGVPDRAGPGRDVGAWWDHVVRPLREDDTE